MNYGNNRKIFPCNELASEVEWSREQQQCHKESKANGIYQGINGVINGSKNW